MPEGVLPGLDAEVSALLAGAVAAAEPKGEVRLSPAFPQAGAQVELRVTGCSGRGGVASSPVFVADADLSARDGVGRPLFGEAMVGSRTAPGRYAVTVVCAGSGGRFAGSFEVLAPGAKPPVPVAPVPSVSPAAPVRPQGRRPAGPASNPPPAVPRHASPVAPVRAGGGGMAARPADPADRIESAAGAGRAGRAAGSAHVARELPGGDGPGLPHAVIGGLLAAAACLAFAARSPRLRARVVRRRSGGGRR
ncbi:hypothetical protein ACN20G_17100 [Streptomyces sp. BI20]|uniref:hypothetical protein n=1 Tax=Streptomyces sp. BI20 TaxID=3403460 RepID=UPI003C7842D4